MTLEDRMRLFNRAVQSAAERCGLAFVTPDGTPIPGPYVFGDPKHSIIPTSRGARGTYRFVVCEGEPGASA